uniref:SF4 helicase domain-containing protein n=1 Tax=Globisporangium ultimum (strain ATCC 200006 / CBS 805.95 / DAOM BR144) TaxID=431595 RepID=K3WZ52_GLOUD
MSSSGVQANRNTFVSSYYQLEDPQEIAEFLGRKKLVSRETDTHFVVRDCPFCHPTHGKADNIFKLYVQKAQGVYKCHRCGASGSWFDFKSKLQSNIAVNSMEGVMHGGGASSIAEAMLPKVIQALDNAKAMAIQQNLLEEPEFQSVLRYLTETRGIKKEVLQKYGVGAIEQPFRNDVGDLETSKCISFPWMARQQDLDAMGVICDSETPQSGDKNLFNVIRLKIRAVDDKAKQRLVPKGGSWGLFGWNTVPTASDEIVITEGEFDAMAVYQATGMPAISLPNGCQSLPPSVLPLLERFKKIYLWMDNDASGQANVEKFSSKIGVTRCYIVRPSPPVGAQRTKPIKDANDALLAGLDLGAIVRAAERIPHSQITTFDELRREVYEEILNPLRACGVQSRTLPSLNRLLKGHRMGEVTVLTGPTGCGKTTLLSQLSIDLCGQGVSTLWGSFEIKNTRLMHKMLNQLAGRSLQGDINAFESAADKFEALPMYFMRFFGSTDVDEVLDAMEYAVYAYDVQHILLDNIQFMMAGQGRGFDKFERQDAALDKFRKFASQKNVHLTLVIHPRKEQEDVDLTLTSVFGTAKATQEADNVLILQRTRGNSKLDVRKNRFDGTLGSIPLTFDSESNCLRELNEETMSENVASVDLEAQMAFEQKLRQQKASRSAAAMETTTTAEALVNESPVEFDSSYNQSANESSTFDEYGESTARQYQFAAANGAKQDELNGSSPSSYHLLNGSSIRKPNGDSDDKPNGLAGGRGGLNGSSSKRGPNGVNGSGREPFSAFTPIITR